MTTRNLTISPSLRSTSYVRTSQSNIYPVDVDETLTGATNISLVPAEHVIRKGFPHSPDLHVSSDVYISADGSYVDEPTYIWEDIYKGAHTRFAAMENLWDGIGGKWLPLSSYGVNYSFTYPLGGVEPRLEEIEYRIGKEFYSTPSVRIEQETSLISSFNEGLDDASTFMIAIAGVINSSERASLIRIGDTIGDSIEVSVDEYFYLRNQYGTAVLQPYIHPARMIPFYMVVINDPTHTELRVASGISRIQRISIPNQASSRSLNVKLGEDLESVKALSMNIFGVVIFPYAYGGDMSPDQIITAMASVHGST